MARYKEYDYDQMKKTPVSFDRQILPGRGGKPGSEKVVEEITGLIESIIEDATW